MLFKLNQAFEILSPYRFMQQLGRRKHFLIAIKRMFRQIVGGNILCCQGYCSNIPITQHERHSSYKIKEIHVCGRDDNALAQLIEIWKLGITCWLFQKLEATSQQRENNFMLFPSHQSPGELSTQNSLQWRCKVPKISWRTSRQIAHISATD